MVVGHIIDLQEVGLQSDLKLHRFVFISKIVLYTFRYFYSENQDKFLQNRDHMTSVQYEETSDAE